MALHSQLPSWYNTETGVPQGSFLDPLLLFIYVNDLSDCFTTNAMLIADDVSIFSVFDNINVSATNLNIGFSKINVWANQWKMSFKPHPNKQTQEVIFSSKKKSHHPLNSNNNSVKQVQFQKFLGIYLDGKLEFHEHL